MTVRHKAQPTPPVSPYVDPDGAAQFLLISGQTLANWRLGGQGPPFSKIGNKVIYAVSDLIAFVAERKVTSTSQIEYSGRPRGRPPKASKPAPIRDATPERARAPEAVFHQTEDQPAPLASPAE